MSFQHFLCAFNSNPRPNGIKLLVLHQSFSIKASHCTTLISHPMIPLSLRARQRPMDWFDSGKHRLWMIARRKTHVWGYLNPSWLSQVIKVALKILRSIQPFRTFLRQVPPMDPLNCGRWKTLIWRKCLFALSTMLQILLHSSLLILMGGSLPESRVRLTFQSWIHDYPRLHALLPSLIQGI